MEDLSVSSLSLKSAKDVSAFRAQDHQDISIPFRRSITMQQDLEDFSEPYNVRPRSAMTDGGAI